MLWGNTAYCVRLSGEDLSHYSNKIESVGLRKCPPTYIRVRAVVWKCGEGQTHKQTDRHTDARDQYTFRVVYDSREMRLRKSNLKTKPI